MALRVLSFARDNDIRIMTALMRIAHMIGRAHESRAHFAQVIACHDIAARLDISWRYLMRRIFITRRLLLLVLRFAVRNYGCRYGMIIVIFTIMHTNVGLALESICALGSFSAHFVFIALVDAF